MANCAIYQKGSDQITYFIRDCIQAGRDFRGSNGSVTGVKEHLFDTKWTEDMAEHIPSPDSSKVLFDRKVSELTEALRYEGHVVSTAEDVNAVTRALIAERYPDSDEKKIHRLKLAGDETGWKDYQEYVDGLVQKGRKFKEEHFK